MSETNGSSFFLIFFDCFYTVPGVGALSLSVNGNVGLEPPTARWNFGIALPEFAVAGKPELYLGGSFALLKLQDCDVGVSVEANKTGQNARYFLVLQKAASSVLPFKLQVFAVVAHRC